MKRLITFCIISFGMLTASMAAEKHPADYVNPFVGTTNFGTTNPGAVCPNGMMSVVPFNVMGSEDNKYDKDAGVSAVPDSARISQVVGLEYDPTNYLLMHAMGPNVAGVIGSAVAAGILLGFLM